MASLMWELNLELGRPAVHEAISRLETQLRSARQMQAAAVKLIHGYGSSGTGGKIRTACRKWLQEETKRGGIRCWIPGERFTIFDEDTRRAFASCPALRQDRDLERENRGITLVILR